VLVVDLPGLNGAELIENIRRQGHHVRAVIMSAYSDEETIKAAAEAGISVFIPKPVDLARLTRVIGGPGSPGDILRPIFGLRGTAGP
jgi:DNA-binding NarL/FixJ family response regulator